MMFLMMKEAIRRAEAALDDVLALCKSGDASTGELRMGLGAFKVDAGPSSTPARPMPPEAWPPVSAMVTAV